jgi:hypothetical protein
MPYSDLSVWNKKKRRRWGNRKLKKTEWWALFPAGHPISSLEGCLSRHRSPHKTSLLLPAVSALGSSPTSQTESIPGFQRERDHTRNPKGAQDERDPSPSSRRRLQLRLVASRSRTTMAAPSPSPVEAAPPLEAAAAAEEDEWGE